MSALPPKADFILYVVFASDALAAVSALFPTLATAASSSSVVLLRRLRIRRAKSLVEIISRFRGGFDRDKVATAVLRWIKIEPPKQFSFLTTFLEGEIVSSVFVINRYFVLQAPCALYPRKRKWGFLFIGAALVFVTNFKLYRRN